MASLTEQFARDQRLSKEWALLENQRKLQEALIACQQQLWGMDNSSATVADQLCVRVSREIVLTCQRIWDLSAQDGIEAVNV